ncbi:MAG: NAD-dependent epimerase/dehydratase family protein [Candidatus Krumholzibacteriia bacterium]
MKALVTGGAGFIGSNIVARLVADGHQVVVLDNLMSGFRGNLLPFPEVQFIQGDVRDQDAVLQAIAGCEVVFHQAASVGNKRSIDHPLIDAEINVMGTVMVLEACRAAGVRKIVTASSAGIFGELVTLPIREDHPVEPDSPYGCTKLAKEKLCLVYAKLHGLEAVCLRYFNVYGPNQRFDAYGNVIPIFVFQALRGQELTIYGDGEQTRDFINVGDVVQANLKAADARGVSGAFNLGSASRITINRLAELIRGAGVPCTWSHGPERPGDVRDSLADISAAQRAFGFEPTIGMEEGLAEYVAWARQEVANPCTD